MVQNVLLHSAEISRIPGNFDRRFFVSQVRHIQARLYIIMNVATAIHKIKKDSAFITNKSKPFIIKNYFKTYLQKNQRFFVQ